ncbi:hypothetical protein QCA50_017392 [Cerrena zonata]|uniref:Uncharacterized protein n=1 Tax=Cerrena zonata TaxID=2478898 RepID=A0AAW0FDP0_9APHY
MSATLVLTRPHDLYHIGRLWRSRDSIRIGLQTMIRDMTKAQSVGSNERDERGCLERGLLPWAGGSTTSRITFAQYSMHWEMNKIASDVRRHIIRRDSNSVTYNGKSIIDIKPYKYVALELALTPN